MTILGIDTATPSTVVALQRSGGELLEARDDPGGPSRGQHAERVLELAASLLEQTSTRWSEIELIAVGLGPGGYTGLRIGIATARGLARAHGASIVGIGTLRALAEPVHGATALTVLDARRGELFVAAYADGVEVLAPAVLAPAALAALALPSGAPPPLAVGDGALAHRATLEEAGLRVAPEGSVLHRVSAGALCRLARAVPAEELDGSLEPIYLRLPDAELALNAK